MCRVVIFIICLNALSVCAQTVFLDKEPKTPEQLEKNKLSVIEKLKQLFQPADLIPDEQAKTLTVRLQNLSTRGMDRKVDQLLLF